MTQGASASRPGLSYSNIISRELNCEILNYGFSGNANLKDQVARIIFRNKNIDLIIIDDEANAGMSDNLVNRLDRFYQVIKENGIVLISKLFDAELVKLNEGILRKKSWCRQII
ncbi:MAG: SGNH/GDSL hydrolase family protein [Bacilli bacterium]|nr:SGNH/GDSL hydrolase family protein [Bacilli bacterium]